MFLRVGATRQFTSVSFVSSVVRTLLLPARDRERLSRSHRPAASLLFCHAHLALQGGKALDDLVHAQSHVADNFYLLPYRGGKRRRLHEQQFRVAQHGGKRVIQAVAHLHHVAAQRSLALVERRRLLRLLGALHRLGPPQTLSAQQHQRIQPPFVLPQGQRARQFFPYQLHRRRRGANTD